VFALTVAYERIHLVVDFLAQRENMVLTTQTVEMQVVEPIGTLRSFATQSDFDSRLWRETWYGQHSPCCRLFLFMVLLTVTTAFGVLIDLQSMMNPPILRIMTAAAELESMSQSHKGCMREICEVAQTINLDCIINADGKSARLDYDSYEGPFQVPLPQKCLQAADETLGTEWREVLEVWRVELGFLVGDSQIQLFGIDNGSDASPPAVVTVKSHCSVTLFAFVMETDAASENAAIPLITSGDIIEGAGQRFENIFTETVCDSYSPFFEQVHEFVMTYRCMAFVIGTLSLSWIVVSWLVVFWIAPGLILSAVVAWWLLPWPKEVIGFERVTLFKIWQAMVLLTILTTERDSTFCIGGQVALVAILSCAALHYGDRSAAIHWIDLAVLWFGAPFLYPYLDAAAAHIRAFDALNLVGFIAGLVGIFLPGRGWWKGVHLYAFWRAYPLRQQVQRNLLVRLGLAKKEESPHED